VLWGGGAWWCCAARRIGTGFVFLAWCAGCQQFLQMAGLLGHLENLSV